MPSSNNTNRVKLCISESESISSSSSSSSSSIPNNNNTNEKLNFLRQTLLSSEEYASNQSSANNTFTATNDDTHHHKDDDMEEQQRQKNLRHLLQAKIQSLPSPFQRKFLLPTSQAFFIVEPNFKHYFEDEDEDEQQGDGDEQQTTKKQQAAPSIIVKSLHPSFYFSSSSSSGVSSSSSPATTTGDEHHHHHHHHDNNNNNNDNDNDDTQSHAARSSVATYHQQKHSTNRYWTVRLFDVTINTVVGLTLVQFFDCTALMIVLKHGVVLLHSTAKGKVLSRQPNSSNKTVNSSSSTFVDNVIPLNLPTTQANDDNNTNTTQQITRALPNGLLLAAGSVNTISGRQKNLHIGFVSQTLSVSAALGPASRMMNSLMMMSLNNNHNHSSTSNTGAAADSSSPSSKLIKWVRLSEDQQFLNILPTSVARNFDSKFACSFEGAPFVYVWLNDSSNHQNANNNGFLLQDSGAGTTSHNQRFSSIRSAFLTTTQQQKTRNTHHHHHHNNDDFININSHFHSITSMTWTTNSTLVAGTNCGHLSVIELSSSPASMLMKSSTASSSSTTTTQFLQNHNNATAFEHLNSVRLPVRSSVPASVEYLISLGSSSPISENNGNNDQTRKTTNDTTSSNILLCATNRCDFFIIDAVSLVVTHAVFSQSSFLRELVSCDASQQSVFDPETPILFLCKETASDGPLREPGFCALGFIDQNYIDGQKLSPKRLTMKASSIFDLTRKSFSFVDLLIMSMNNNNTGQTSNHHHLQNNTVITLPCLHRRENGSFGIMANEMSRQVLVSKWFCRHHQSSQHQENDDDNDIDVHQTEQQEQDQAIIFTDKNDHSYQLLEPPVGSGAFGEVWLATSTTTKKIFAIKRLIGAADSSSSGFGNYNKNNTGGGGTSSNENTAAAHTLANEEQLFNSVLPHPNLLQAILSVAGDQQHQQKRKRNPDLGLVLSFAFGCSLESKLLDYCHLHHELVMHQQQHQQEKIQQQVDDTLQQKADSISPISFISWFNQLLSGLSQLHACGINHRDVKPANVIDRGHWKENCHVFCWSDFGVSRLLDKNNQHHQSNNNRNHHHNNPLTAKTKMATNVGTPAWQAPELLSSFGLSCASAPSSQASDVWSLAAMFYCFLLKRPDGIITAVQEIPAVIDGRLPKLVDEKKRQSQSSILADNQQQQHYNLLLQLPDEFLELLDTMMEVERKMRPTAAQCLSNFVLSSSSSSSNRNRDFYGLGSKSVLVKDGVDEETATISNYVLYSHSPSCLPSSIIRNNGGGVGGILLSDETNEFNKLEIVSREYFEFWPLEALEPQQLFSSSPSNRALIPSSKIICDKLLIQIPHRSLGEAIRAGVASCNAAASFHFQKQQSTQEDREFITAALLPPRFISDHVCLAPLLSVSCDYVSRSSRQAKTSSTVNNDGTTNATTTTATPSFYETHFAPPEDLSICVEYSIDLPIHDRQKRTALSSNHLHHHSHSHSPSLPLHRQHHEPIRSIITAAEWLDGARDLRDCIHRFNKIFRNVLKFISYTCTESSLSSLPAVSFDFSDLFIHTESEKVIIGRSTNLLTISLLLDGAEEQEDHVCSKLLNTVLVDSEIKRHAGLMQRSTLDVVMMVTDNFFSVYQEKIIQVHHQQQQQSQSNSSSVSSSMSVFCRATEFVGSYIQHLQNRKRKLMKALDLVYSPQASSASRKQQQQLHFDDVFSQPSELVEPDSMITPEFTNFFSVVV